MTTTTTAKRTIALVTREEWHEGTGLTRWREQRAQDAATAEWAARSITYVATNDRIRVAGYEHDDFDLEPTDTLGVYELRAPGIQAI